MKKTLLTLGAVAAMVIGLASCGSKDCTCKIEVFGEGQTEFSEDATVLKYSDRDDCEFNLADFGETWNEEDVHFDCDED